ncbi:MAG: hypothetical protein KF773_32575 [Deltaproteobacteria bacterium]|nr:hypothetical protein [Deltaproteobacteria bacterium]MCW5801927.1 hypothetical protein [Deltaproteobacteria bacterium]
MEETSAPLTSSNKLATNSLLPNRLVANRLGTNSLTNAMLSAPELLATPGGREVLTYVISCALEPRAQLVLQDRGTRYTFEGGLGLAPAWRFHVPTQAERRWVTACVLARTNLFGAAVPLSLRGANPALQPALLEPAGYALVEGAFYGDLFAPDGPKLFACDALVRDLDLGLSTQDLRACVMSDASGQDGATTRCGFTYAGRCSVADLAPAPACTSLLPAHRGCRGGGDRYDEVITVYLQTRL